MTFLALDTGGDWAVVTLADNAGSLLAATVFEGRRSLSRALIGQIDVLLASRALSIESLDALAISIGPGSFTGIRVGLTTAKTLSQVTGKPLLGINRLEALARPIADATAIPLILSRRDEVYAAVYRDGVCLRQAFATAPGALDSLVAEFSPQGPLVFCGETDHVPTGMPGVRIRQPWPTPESLAQIAASRLATGDFDDPLGLVPLYVVAPAITIPRDPRMPPFSN